MFVASGDRHDFELFIEVIKPGTRIVRPAPFFKSHILFPRNSADYDSVFTGLFWLTPGRSSGGARELREHIGFEHGETHACRLHGFAVATSRAAHW